MLHAIDLKLGDFSKLLVTLQKLQKNSSGLTYGTCYDVIVIIYSFPYKQADIVL